MSKIIHFPDGTMKTDKGVPIIITGKTDYQVENKENQRDAGCEQ